MSKLFYWNRDNNRLTLCILGIKLKFQNKNFKPKTFKITGCNNKIYFISQNSKVDANLGENIKGLNVVVNGNNNIISLCKHNQYTNCTIFITGDNTNIEIFESKYLIRNLGIWCNGNNNIIKISKDTSFESCDIHSIEDNCNVYIGRDCAFSRNVKIYPTDGHLIIDTERNKIVNIPKPIKIKDHCWVGDSVVILKGTKLESHTILGAGSVVTKSFEDSNVVIAGNPARIIKRNVQWKRDTATNETRKRSNAGGCRERERERERESNPPSCLVFNELED